MSAETGLIPEREDAEKLLHDFDAAIPVTEAAPMGLQHVVAAIAGIVTPTVLLGNAVKGAAPDTTTLLISAGLIFFGLATLIQSFPIFKRFGARLPLLFGSAVAYVPVLMTIGANYGLGAVFTSQIIGGAAVMFLGFVHQKDPRAVSATSDRLSHHCDRAFTISGRGEIHGRRRRSCDFRLIQKLGTCHDYFCDRLLIEYIR